jgi:acetyl-CoA carboxylase biotin carboxylase subunit
MTMTGKVTKVLIANRGEIAVRVMRTCREMGIPTVAVYSDPDRRAMHVRYATEAYHIGAAAPSESYLRIDKIIEVAKRSGADAIHPGYGFLAENADFVRATQEAGLTFIGPSAESMDAMGSKTAARQVMADAGVPIVPGLKETIEDVAEAGRKAEEIGYPVMLKATAGGGGKGMRKVDKASEFASAWRAARSEANNSFGDDAVYIEKFLEKPRHIEVQVFADSHGNVHHYFERECSVQRRHQKIIEEAPSPFVTPDMRKQMGEVACRAAKAVNYLGAGTVEFLVDAHRNFYFMEMNTRLQVEHPVTEMITGLDLVELQIQVARGEALPDLKRDRPRGWAMEARVCAEDARNNFVPTPGPVHHVRNPGGPFVRSDTAVFSGSEVTPDYDPMIAKIIAWGPDRATAMRRLDRALSEFTIKGCMTNTMFLRQILHFEPFVSGDYDTGVIERFKAEGSEWVQEDHQVVAMLASAFYAFEREQRALARVVPAKNSNGSNISSWRRMTSPHRTAKC